MRTPGQQLGGFVAALVALALLLPWVVARLEPLAEPLLIVAGVVIALRALWYWTSL